MESMSNYSSIKEVLETYTSFDDDDVPSPEYRTLLGEPVIFAAARNGDLGAIRLLLECDADVNSRGEYGNTPLHSAIEACQFDAARYLLSKGADPNMKNQEGKLPRDCCWEGEWLGIFGESNV